ncbi:MAG: exodeoxyribonuclease III [Bacteroidetes bacterium]|nr:exodeoxyribonuclease III [Bacteroidota bacterium]
MKIYSYNVNGIRAAMRKGLSDWLQASNADVLLIQETKAQADQIEEQVFSDMGYHTYWHSAEKKGYSGVGILCKQEPDHVEIGCGIDYIDFEGRIIRADFGDLSIMSVYIPSGSSGDARQDVKMTFLNDFQNYIQELLKERPKLIIGGDFNICHTEIDIHNPKSNKNTSGFLPEEREWLSGFLKLGFTDSFRLYHEGEADHYSWWSYRANARNNNKGWRIDYNMASEALREQLEDAKIWPDAKHSDHCPISLDIS